MSMGIGIGIGMDWIVWVGGWCRTGKGTIRDVLRLIVGLDFVFGRVVFGVFWGG